MEAAAAVGGLERVLDQTGTPLPPKTKIVCTLGPKCRDVSVLEEMLRAGMAVARFNFSHGDHAYHFGTLENLRQASRNTGIAVAVLLDTKGPEIRTGFLENGDAIELKAGQELILTTDYSFKGGSDKIAVSYGDLARDVAPGSRILMADGSISLTVHSCNVTAGEVAARVENDAKLGERKNCNLPGVKVNLPTMTDKDKVDILDWGVYHKVDFVAASFVRKASDVVAIRGVLGESGRHVKIISKIENQEGIENFDDILRESDGIMVARGDLGMEIPLEKIFVAQKMMILKCNLAGKPVITATQMLESMCTNPRPTRAESTDVANAVLDGTDCVMLSGETANGAFPVGSVTTMARICKEAEGCIDYYTVFKAMVERSADGMTTVEAIASSAVRMASKINAAMIVVLSSSGGTAKLIAKYRPPVPVCVAVAGQEDDLAVQEVVRGALASRGLVPIVVAESNSGFNSKTKSAGGMHRVQSSMLSVAMETASSGIDSCIAEAIAGMKLLGHKTGGQPVVAVYRVGESTMMKILTQTA